MVLGWFFGGFFFFSLEKQLQNSTAHPLPQGCSMLHSKYAWLKHTSTTEKSLSLLWPSTAASTKINT